MTRRESVAGSFYPASENEIRRYFGYFSEIFDKHASLPDIKTRSVIVPHAGYVYSGFSANVAYRVLQKSGVKKFVVIGPSHRVAFQGWSMCDFSTYATPLGALDGWEEMYEKLSRNFKPECYLQAHAEHSTEVQFPFIKYYVPDAKIVEIVYSDEDPKALAKVIEFIMQDRECGVIISTDLSHFYDLDSAKKLDAICIDAIEHLDPKLLHRGCEACGKIGVEAFLEVAKTHSFSPVVLDYRTSADASGDTSRVVGYLSVAFVEKR